MIIKRNKTNKKAKQQRVWYPTGIWRLLVVASTATFTFACPNVRGVEATRPSGEDVTLPTFSRAVTFFSTSIRSLPIQNIKRNKNKTKRDETKRHQTKQNTTRKTRQNKTKQTKHKRIAATKRSCPECYLISNVVSIG